MRFLFKIPTLAACVVLVAVALSAGCGSKGAVSPGSSPAKSSAVGDSTGKVTTPSGDGKDQKSADEQAAMKEALRFAEDANAGSTFKVINKKVIDGWARVSVEQTGVPADEAVGFGVYMQKSESGRWEVKDSGTGLSPGDLPGAPPEIFKTP